MRLVASEGLHQIVVGELVEAMSAPVAGSEAGLCTVKLGQERWLMESVPYHLPGRVGAELLTSDPPDGDLLERIRLPYRSVLVLFDQIGLSALASAQLEETLHLDSATAIADPESRSIVGVLLAADADGRLEPWVQWLVAEHVIDRGWSVGVEVGLWQRSAYTGAVANLAAICTWGDWRPPPAAPPQMNGVAEGTRDWRRSLQRSASRRAVQRGALTGVRVLDVPAVPRPSAGRPPRRVDGRSACTGGRDIGRTTGWPPATPTASSSVRTEANETSTGTTKRVGCVRRWSLLIVATSHHSPFTSCTPPTRPLRRATARSRGRAVTSSS